MVQEGSLEIVDQDGDKLIAYMTGMDKQHIAIYTLDSVILSKEDALKLSAWLIRKANENQ